MAEKVDKSTISSNIDSIVSTDSSSGITDEKNPENILKFENLISGFSAALIGVLEGTLGNKLDSWLKKFVEFFEVDRCIVNEFMDDEKTIHSLMDYTVPEIDIDPVAGIYEPPDGVIKKLRQGFIIKAGKIPEDLPEVFRGGMIEKTGAKSAAIVPFSSNNRVVGTLLFVTYRNRYTWSDDIIRRIKLIGEIIVNAILRIRSRQHLLETIEDRRLLEETFSSVIKNSNLGFMIINLKDHSIIDVNDEYCRMSGYGREELIHKKTWEIDASMDPEKIEKEKESTIQEGSIHLITSHRRKDGSLFDVEISGSLFGKDDDAVYSFVRDITDIKKVQKDLEERLEFEKITSEFSAAIINIDPDQINDELNKWLKKIVEFLKVDRGIVNEHLYDRNMVHLLLNYTVPGIDIPLVHYHQIPGGVRHYLIEGISVKAEKIPDDLPEGLRGGLIEKENVKSIIIVPIVAGNKVFGNLTLISYREECKWSDELVRSIKLMGEIIASAVMRERSHRKILEETELRKMMEERYTSVLENANVGFLLSDMDRNIIDVNDEYCRMSGYSRNELLTMKIKDVRIPLEREEYARVSWEIESKGSTHHEGIHRKKDGSFMELDISTAVLGNKTFFSFMRDITELNQRRREQAERLRFEELVSEFSAELINIKPDEIRSELKRWLEKFVNFLGVDRSVVHEYINDHEYVQVLLSYTVPGVGSPIENIRKTPDGVISELEKGVIKAEKIPEDLPPVFRGTLVEKYKTRSIIVVPLLTGNRVFGNLSFSSSKKERKWPDELVRRVKLVGEIVGNAILRMRSHEALIEEMARRQVMEEKYLSILKNASVGFWITDLSNLSILDVNDEYCRMTGYSQKELINKKVWEIDAALDIHKVKKELKNMVEQNSFHLETTHKKKDGGIIDVAISSRVFEKDGIVCSFIRDITGIKNAQRDMAERLEFEELVSRFSATLINISPDKIKNELKFWLRHFVETLRIDRGMVIEYPTVDNNIHTTLHYTVPGINVPIDEDHETPKDIIVELEKGKIIQAEKIPEDLPHMYRGGLFEKTGTKSVIIMPLLTGNKAFGNLTLINYRQERKWPEELVRRVRLIGEIIGNSILRMRAYEHLTSETERRKMLEERYTTIIKNASVGFWISDLQQNILAVNDEYCRMTGYTRDELLNLKISDIDASCNPGKVDREGRGIKIEGTLHHFSRHLRKDGEIIDVEINSSFLPGEDIVFSFFRDITELNAARRELEERLKFEELVSEFSAALINVKIDNIKDELNIWLERFSQFLKVDKCGIGEYQENYTFFRFICTYTNQNLDPKLPPFSLDPIPAAYGIEKYFHGGDYIKIDSPNDLLPDDIKEWGKRVLKDGTKSILMLPLFARKTLLGCMAISSIENEKEWTPGLIRRLKLVAEIFANAIMREKTDAELDNYRKDLEKMVDEQTAELKEAQRELILSEKMATLGRLTATVSHELRNPLGTVRASVFSVRQRLKGQDESVVTALERAERNIRRCDLIIDELLNYSRAQDLFLEPTLIDAWLSELVDETPPPKGIFIKKELNSNIKIYMDRERFRRGIVNILTNAYQSIQEKGLDEPGYVHIVSNGDMENLIIEISDNGVGFDMGNKNKIFEPLYSTKTYGVGLGIPITRQIIEQHGWNMDITGEPQRGASVKITIPL